MNHICQSCGMYMDNESLRETNTDQSLSEDYCVYCFQNGSFCTDETMEQMAESCIPFYTDEATDEATNEAAARKKLLEYLPTLKRWKDTSHQ